MGTGELVPDQTRDLFSFINSALQPEQKVNSSKVSAGKRAPRRRGAQRCGAARPAARRLGMNLHMLTALPSEGETCQSIKSVSTSSGRQRRGAERLGQQDGCSAAPAASRGCWAAAAPAPSVLAARLASYADHTAPLLNSAGFHN